MLSSPGNPAEWILCRHRASRAVLTSVHLSGRYQGHSTSLLLLFIFWNNEIYTVPNSIMEKEVSQSCGSLEGERSSEAGTAADVGGDNMLVFCSSYQTGTILRAEHFF